MTQRKQPALTGDEQILNRRWRLWGVILALILLLTGFRLARQRSIFAAAVRTQGVRVVAATARRADLNVYLNEVGTVKPLKKVTVHTRVDGELVHLYFKEGQMVRAGDLLALIDPRPYEVQLTQADGQMARDRALLFHARAKLAQ
jgi:multidrug efflux system membrane fusion protein